MYVLGCVFLKMVDNSSGSCLNVPHLNKHVKLPVGDFTMHYAEKYMGVRHGSFWFCMSAPIIKKTSHIFTQQGSETCRLTAKLDAPNVHSSLQLQFIFKESKFKIKYYLASTRSPHSV